jgi:hypothetical protein
MPDFLNASTEERLWHKMRGDLAKYVPEVAASQLLMCPCCGRFLPREAFDLEHIITRQAVKLDPDAVRENPTTPVNVRSGNLLLCKKPLKHGSRLLYQNGCNSWKGKHYDKAIRELVSASWTPKATTPLHTIAALCLGYIGMVSEYGYRVVLMQSGSLMRRQFFEPSRYLPELPLPCRILLIGGLDPSIDNRMWLTPFAFKMEENWCIVVARNFAIRLPCTRDPRLPIAQRLRFVPEKYRLRPHFGISF